MRVVHNERKVLSWSMLSLLVIFLAQTITYVKGYPMMLEIGEEDERCLRLNIPDDDDAHMVFLALPSAANDEEDGSIPKWIQNYSALESHFMGQMQEITKRRTKNSALLRKFPVKPPPEIQASMDSFLESYDGELKSECKVRLTNPKSTSSRMMDTFWFTPLVINHIRRAIRTHKKDRESSPLEGYMACFLNESTDPVHIIMDSVMVSEGPEYDDDENESEDETFQGHHLAPLADQLQESIHAARTVIHAMQEMERRESRMRQTADGINARVQYFSYISVGILLVVTYLQVTYLKRYFRKKKLL
mmetsp:Transcript_38418/g.80450  ORF Transcript_38418/g.80450 Transcript_38418/m.80450 type:complete len:304 (+) Transcript_38418:252-1163(+)